MKKILMTVIEVIILIIIVIAIQQLWENPSIFDTYLTPALSANDNASDRGSGLDTITSANGHSFTCKGDVTFWDGWYFDTIPVGDNIMLSYDSIAPSQIKLSLVTRDIVICLHDKDAANKIRSFMNPIKGFKRFYKDYEVTLDSILDKESGVLRCIGYYSFSVDYADTCAKNADKINRFICKLTDISKNETVNVPELSALYAGFQSTKYYRPAYTGNENNMLNLSDFLANKTFENWKRGGNTDESSNGARLQIRAHIANSKFVTVSLHDYDRIGPCHGMYSETFHTLDLESEKELTNKDLFKSKSFDKVKQKLSEVMARDEHYIAWNPDGPEGKKSNSEIKFYLPEGAMTETGIVFSFQPYELNCWAAGAFHFIVPYKDLIPYMTTKSKKLVSTLNNKLL